MNILLISHQLDFTGAPIALLNLAQTLLKLGHEVSLVSRKPGPLGAAFLQAGVKPADRQHWQTHDVYIANTLLSIPLGLKLAPSPSQLLAWIHEAHSLMHLMKLDATTLGLHQLRHACFPSRFQIQEYQALMPDCDMRQLRNMVSLDGLDTPTTAPHAYAVPGPWNAVKNQAGLLSLMTASGVDAPLAFIGASCPAHLAGTALPHVFHGHVRPQLAQALIANARGLISASLNETQNRSAIEALMTGKPVLLSRIPAHQELQSLIPDIVLFDPQDPSSFAQGFARLQSLSAMPELLRRMQTQASQHFGAHAFTASVQALIETMSP